MTSKNLKFPEMRFLIPYLHRAEAVFLKGVEFAESNDYKQALHFFREAYAMYTRIPRTQHEQASCLHGIGRIMSGLGSVKQAHIHLNQALSLLQSLNDSPLQEASCHRTLGNALRRAGDFSKAHDHFTQALDIYRSHAKTEHDQAACLGEIGITLRYQRRYPESFNMLTRALDLFQTLPNTQHEQVKCLGALANTLSSLGQLADARNTLLKVLDFYENKIATPIFRKDRATCLINLGSINDSEGNLAQAKRCFNEALSLYQTLQGTQREQARCLENLGTTHKRAGHHREAIAYFKKALHIYQDLEGLQTDQASCLLNLSSVLRLDSRLDEAEWNLALATTLAELAQDSGLTQSIDCEHSILQSTIALKTVPPDIDTLNEALERVIPIAIHNDEGRFVLDSSLTRRQWIENVAQPRMELALFIANKADRSLIVGELVAKWRLSGTIESRTLETNLPILVEGPVEQGSDTATNGHVDDSTDLDEPYPLGIRQLAVLPGGTTDVGVPGTPPIHNTPAHNATRRSHGPLIHMPYGEHCEIAKHIPNADLRPHVKYR